MDIPLTDSVTVTARTGEGAYGPTWSTAPVTVRCNAEPSHTVLTSASGQEVVASLFLIMPPGTVILAGDLVTRDGENHEVFKVEKFYLFGNVHHLEVTCTASAQVVLSTWAAATLVSTIPGFVVPGGAFQFLDSDGITVVEVPLVGIVGDNTPTIVAGLVNNFMVGIPSPNKVTASVSGLDELVLTQDSTDEDAVIWLDAEDSGTDVLALLGLDRQKHVRVPA